jgi:hypothetical protein
VGGSDIVRPAFHGKGIVLATYALLSAKQLQAGQFLQTTLRVDLARLELVYFFEFGAARVEANLPERTHFIRVEGGLAST